MLRSPRGRLEQRESADRDRWAIVTVPAGFTMLGHLVFHSTAAATGGTLRNWVADDPDRPPNVVRESSTDPSGGRAIPRQGPSTLLMWKFVS